MRILLTSNASYAPPRGGATRSNLVWLDRLARAGHKCRIVCGAEWNTPPSVVSGPTSEDQPFGAGPRGHPVSQPPAAGVATFAVREPARRVHLLRLQIREFQPDWVLVSSEDLGHALLREAHHSAPGRVVYLAHTPQFFPFGPASWNPQRPAAEMVAQSAGIVAIGRHMAGYIERAVERPVAVIHPPIYGPGPFADYASFERGLVTMINPCAVKGLSIFVNVVGRLPSLEFGVVPGWGTTSGDRRALQRLPNVRFLPNARNIDEVLAQTRLLLMPSLWYEGFGLIVMESMLRGIPVVASDSGGLVEAKGGTGYVIPVHTIERYQPVFDEHGMPLPVVAENPVGPWLEALDELLGDRRAYQRESAASRQAAERFVAGLDAGRMEAYLGALRPAPNETSRAPAERTTIESLSPEKRALLLERARKRRAAR